MEGVGAVLGASAMGCGSSEPGSDVMGDDGWTPTGGRPPGGNEDGESVVDPNGDSSSGIVDEAASSGSSSGGPAVEPGPEPGSTGGDPPVAQSRCVEDLGLAPEELLSEIDTIVVLMMENRSFDHYFGSAAFLERWPVVGLTGQESNPNLAGEPISVFHLANRTPVDPPHGWDQCHAQWNFGANDGFVREHETTDPGSAREVMGFHIRADIPTFYRLAESYALCDHWFASVMGPTWPNRFYLHSGSSNGQISNNPEAGLAHIWDHLADAGYSGRNYYSDLAWAWGGFVEPLASYTSSIDRFFEDAQQGTLPNFSVIDPDFGTLGGGGNDDHPPHDIDLGQIFIASVYAALAQSPQWNRCMLVITYDEHGGFYDHVAPPQIGDPIVDFQQLGFRVPAVVIGPHVRRGCVVSNTFDHASVLATVSRRFGVQPPSGRIPQTLDLSSCIDGATLRNPVPAVPLTPMTISIERALAPRPGSGQPELRYLLDRGEIPLPPEHRRVDPGRELRLRWLDRAHRLGAVRLTV